jgi:hypothetical protein
VIDIWITYVLNQFAYTRPWGERSTAWLLELLERFALAAIGAVPGLLTAVLIFVLARLTARAANAFMARVERGELKVGWLDADTAAPTRRLGTAAIWLFALAMAYPYLPGADSEAFKGVTVLAGLMLSLGAAFEWPAWHAADLSGPVIAAMCMAAWSLLAASNQEPD